MSDAFKNRRKTKNFVLDPQSQMKVAAQIFLVGFLITTLLLGFLVFNLTQMLNTLGALIPANMEVESVIAGARSAVWASYGFSILTSILCSILLSLLITHRYLGPLVPIRRFVQALILGESPGALKLREGDEFDGLVDDLNRLAEKSRGE